MNIKTDAMPSAMGKPWDFISRAKACCLNDIPRSPIDRFGGYADLSCSKSGRLGRFFKIPNLALSFAGLSKNIGAGNVRKISIDRRSRIDQHHIAFF